MCNFPFFLIIDDGGFEYAIDEQADTKVGISTYENILRLAKNYSIRIPICFTMKHLDKENISGMGLPLEYSDELIEFLKENKAYVEIGFHGLTHEYNGHCGEFFRMDDGETVPEEIQRKHIQESEAIFASHGLSFPKIFVPPYHGWQRGVTDRLIAVAGGKYIVSIDRMRFMGKSYHWAGSAHLTFLPRASMGISGSDLDLRLEDRKRIKLYPEKSRLDFVRDHLKPQRLAARIRISRSLYNRPVHSYMTHIGNFCSSSMDFWFRLFDTVAADSRMCLCRSNEEAVKYYREAFGGGAAYE
jgi:hypothetical protein